MVELRYNNLDPKSATMLATVAKEKRISLCGVTPEQTEADFSSYKTGSYMWPADAVHIAADLTVRPSLTSIDLSENVIRSEGAKALAPALRDNTSITVVDLRYNQLDSESATILANIAREKNISVCGIKPEQTEADFTPRNNGYNKLNAADAILLAADLTVRPSVTSVRALGNSWSSGECRGSCLLSMLVV